jgi:hypothetical protein
VILGATAVVSALLSSFVPTPAYLFFWAAPLPPALCFGIVLCIGAALWTSRRPFDLFLLLVTSWIAWNLGVQSANKLFHLLPIPFVPPPADSPNKWNFTPPDYLAGICGVLGGFIGSTVVVFGIAASCRSMRTFNGWAQVILIGAVTGFLLELTVPPRTNGLEIHIGSFLPLYLAWQVGVAAAIAYNLKPQFVRPSSPQKIRDASTM